MWNSFPKSSSSVLILLSTLLVAPLASVSADDANGAQFRVFLPSQQQGYPAGEPIRGSTAHDDLERDLSENQARALADHDVVLMIDKSWSMKTTDCQAPRYFSGKLSFLNALAGSEGGDKISRWNWCLAETSHMAKQTERALPDGFSVLVFDSHFETYPHVTVGQVKHIFKDNSPSGGTKLEKPLESTFDQHFQAARQGRSKPLLIGVITDGCPTNPDKVRTIISDATHSMRYAGEITIVFFLIGGHDKKGEQFVYEAAHDWRKDGGAYNIVHSVSFDELRNIGLARALADNLR